MKRDAAKRIIRRYLAALRPFCNYGVNEMPTWAERMYARRIWRKVRRTPGAAEMWWKDIHGAW